MYVLCSELVLLHRDAGFPTAKNPIPDNEILILCPEHTELQKKKKKTPSDADVQPELGNTNLGNFPTLAMPSTTPPMGFNGNLHVIFYLVPLFCTTRAFRKHGMNSVETP